MPRRTDISKVLIIGSGPEALTGRDFSLACDPLTGVIPSGARDLL